MCKSNKDYAWLAYLLIFALAVLASSCKDRPKITPIDSYPYEWDTRVYNERWIYTSPIECQLYDDSTKIEAHFNEEYIEIITKTKRYMFDDDGKWVNKHTFEGNSFLLSITPQTIKQYYILKENGVIVKQDPILEYRRN